jgi:hypothetical protein
VDAGPVQLHLGAIKNSLYAAVPELVL